MSPINAAIVRQKLRHPGQLGRSSDDLAAALVDAKILVAVGRLLDLHPRYIYSRLSRPS